ncbi:hypothetical protein [Nostoc sp.]|uniref:hypothetical protein n=1 Tax=Nostoc sp. TaxID=1180 RepID=UPI002FF94407
MEKPQNSQVLIRTWLASYFPIQSEADEPISMGIVVVEISDRKRAEQMLELQAVITRNMAEGICLVRAMRWRVCLRQS